MKFRIFFLIFYSAFFNLAFADLSSKIDFNIKFSKRTVYYVNSNIILEASLSNISDEVVSLEVADVNTFSFDFLITDTQNIEVNKSIQYVKTRARNVAVPVRNISLRPNERLSFFLSLKDFVSFDERGIYLVKAHFYPNIANKDLKLVSNVITLFLKPASQDANLPLNTLDLVSHEEIEGELKRENLAPDEVVEYILKAKKLSNKEQFFLYMDLESLILSDSNVSYKYRENPDLREEFLKDYKNFLWLSAASDISLIPSKFSILETTYTPLNGKVTAEVSFDEGDFLTVKTYTFFLKRYEYYWIVYDYIVQNTGIKQK